MWNIIIENTITVLVVMATALVVWYVIALASMRKMPPGPFPFPVIGNMNLLWKPGATILSVFAELTKKYGKIFTLHMGDTPIILINDLKLIQESYVKKGDVTSARPYIYYFIQKMHREAGLGLSLSSGLQWKELRRLCITAMRDCGLGKRSLEEKVSEEVTQILEVIDQAKGEAFDLKPALMMATSNVVSSIIFGNRFDYEDSRFKLLLQRLREGTELNTFFLPVNFFPFLRFFTNKEDKFIKTVQTTSAHIKELVADHEETFDPDNIRDLVDLVLKTRQTSPESRHFSDLNMRRAVVDLFGAGSETTAATLQFLLYFMATYPDIQERCQKELDEVLGKGKTALYTQRDQLPFTEATVLELLRVRPAAPFGFPHYISQGFELDGYIIPEGSVAFANILAVSNDPSFYVNPEKFDPSRWLDENGQVTGKERLITFGIGPRSCPGELVARMELLMFFASILQFYTVLPGDESGTLDLTPVLGFISKAKDQNLIFQKR